MLTKILSWAALLLVVAFLANYYNLVSIPWLDVNTDLPTYSEDATHTDTVLKKVFEKSNREE
jgi:hypothetical protein